MLESYSEFYPVPIVLQDDFNGPARFLYEIAYFIKPYKTLFSFGILRASTFKCGKSKFLDDVLSTNFTYNFQGGNQNRNRYDDDEGGNLFDLGRISIQMPRNIDSRRPEVQWSIIDASRFTDFETIKHFS